MVAPLLHTRVRESIDIARSPEHVLYQLQELASEQFKLTVDDSDSDNISFEMLRQREQVPDITISGMIRRWQGTESRLDFRAEVTLAPSNPRRQNMILTIVLSVASLVYWIAILPQQNYFSFILDIPTFLVMAFVTYLFYLIAIYGVSKALIMSSTNDKQRWQLQQEMAQFITQIRALQSDVD